MNASIEGPIRTVEQAARRVLAQIGPPLHVRATIAALETEGLRDIDAAAIAEGCPDLFELGPVVHERSLALAEVAATLARDAPAAPSPSVRARRTVRGVARKMVRDYWFGAAYILPLIAQGLCVAFLGVSLWGSADLSAPQQTAIAAALIGSLIITGPFTYGMTRRLFYYWFQWDLNAVRRTAGRWTAAGIGLGIGVAGLVAAALAATGRLNDVGLTFVVFLALQPAIWMANSVLFVIRRAPVAALAILIPTIPVWLGLRAGLPPLAVHAVGLVLADALLVGSAAYLLRRRARGWPAARRSLPRSVLPIAVAGYATWGFVYFALIFSDRIIAWVEPGGLTWRPSYEAALQIALLPLLLTLPLLEHVIVRLGETMRRGEETSTPANVQVAYRGAEAVFLRTILAALATYVVLASSIWIVIDRWTGDLPLHLGRLVGQGEGRTALAVALVAYGCFVLALGLGAAYQLFGRPWPMVAVGALAVVADITVGVIARSQGPPEAAVFGLLAGGVVFAGGMVAVWAGTRRHLGYWWFAAS